MRLQNTTSEISVKGSCAIISILVFLWNRDGGILPLYLTILAYHSLTSRSLSVTHVFGVLARIGYKKSAAEWTGQK